MGGAIEVRWSELATLERVVDSTNLSPSTVAIIEGEPGIGKTHLLRKAEQHARTQDLLVIDGGLSELEQELPWAGLGSLLRNLDEWQPNAFPHAQRQHLDRAIRRVPTGTVTASEVAFAFAALISAVAAERPLVVAIDDMQWLDRPSATAIVTALRATTAGRLTYLIAVRSGHEPSLDVARVPDISVERISLGGLSVAGVHRVMVQAGLDPLPRPTLVGIHARSAGNPLLAIGLGRRAVASNQEFAALPTALSTDLASLPFDDTTVEVGRAIALMTRPTVTSLRALQCDPDASLAALERAGIVTVHGDEVRFTHALQRDAMLDGVGTIETRQLHRRLADVVADPEQVLFHRAQATVDTDVDLADAMERAADEALRLGLPSLAAQRFGFAAGLTPPDRAGDRWRRLEQFVRQSTTVGDLDHVALASELFESASGDDDVMTAATTLAILQDQTVGGAAAEVTCRAALERLVSPRQRVEILRLLVRLEQFHDVSAGLTSAELMLSDAVRSGDPESIALACSVLAVAQCLAGLPFEIADQPSDTGALNHHAAMHTAEALVWSSRTAHAEQILAPLVNRARAQGHPQLIMQYLNQLGDAHLRCGRWNEALDELQESAEISALMGEAGGGQSDRAWIEAAMGDIARARQELQLEAPLVPSEAHVWRVQHFARAGFVECCAGEWDDAARLLGEARRAADQIHLFEAAAIPFGHDLVEALVHLGRIDEASAEADHLLQAAKRARLPLPMALALRSVALVRSARSEHGPASEAISEAVEAHTDVGHPFEAARTALAAGTLLRRAGQRTQARAHLETALAAFEELGAATFAESARAALDRLVSRRAPDQLTDTERRVAELAARGKSNVEISNELFVAVRTVESNLTRVYRKLGVRSRSQLAGALTSEH